MLAKSFRGITFGLLCGLLVVWAISSSRRLLAQQGLTPPPKPATPKPNKPTETTSPDGAPFTVGERLTYNVAWSNFATAARLELEVADQGAFFGQEGYQLRTKVETAGTVRAIFFELDNQYTTYASLNTLLPYRAENAVRQGPKQAEETIIFDHARREARFPDDTTLPLPTKVYDPTSLIYALRARKLAQGGKEAFTVIVGKQLIEVEAEAKKIERIVSQAGSYNALLIELTPKDKKLDKYRTRLWLSDDAQRVPIAIQARLSFGEVRAELTTATIAARRTPRLRPDPPAESPAIGNGHHYPFDVGERLNYDVAWGNFASVGKASFEVRQKAFFGAQLVFEFAGEAMTVGAARSVINVNDQLISYVTVDGLLPLKTDTRLREGKRVKQTAAEYDWPTKIAKLPNTTQIQLEANTRDLISLFYAVRAAELKPGANYKFPFLDANHRLQTVLVKVVKEETIGGPLGARESLQVDILTADGTALLAQTWISTDARRLPLYLATRTRFGELRFQLTGVVNPR